MRTDTTEPVRLTGLRKKYAEVTAVDGLDLTIRRGEVVALLGPNGAGKSTTIDMLLGLARPCAASRAACASWIRHWPPRRCPAARVR